jgi:arylsulfatase/arylsulfatase A
LFRNGTPERASGYCTDVFFREGIAWAERESQAGRPFFLYLAPNAPHGPYHDVPADLLEHYRSESIAPERFPRPIGHPSTGRFDAETLARTYAMIENIDQNVGRLTDWLARTGLDRSTLVLFLTDNGEATVGYNAGFRGRKTEVLEGGIRSMLLAHWPGRLEPGVASDLPVAHIDLAPTLLEACGVAPTAGVAADRVAEARFDGRSVWPLLTRQPVEWPDRTLFVQSHRGDQPAPRHHFAARSTRWKLVRNSGFGAPSAPADAPYELFDMQADPFETVNLAEREPAVVSNLLAQYDAWFAEVSQTRPDNWSPPRLVVGSPHENPVVLTRQDWRGADWRAGDQGHWLIDVKEGGRYTVTVRGAKGEGDRVLSWSVGGRTESRPLSAGETAVTWRDVELPPGPARLDAWIQEVDRKKGVLFVELTRQ